MGAAMADAIVPMRLGEASSMLAAADATVTIGCAEVDTRIAAGEPPSRNSPHTSAGTVRRKRCGLSRTAIDPILTVPAATYCVKAGRSSGVTAT